MLESLLVSVSGAEEEDQQCILLCYRLPVILYLSPVFSQLLESLLVSVSGAEEEDQQCVLICPEVEAQSMGTLLRMLSSQVPVTLMMESMLPSVIAFEICIGLIYFIKIKLINVVGRFWIQRIRIILSDPDPNCSSRIRMDESFLKKLMNRKKS